MAHQIEIDDVVFDHLKEHAEPFVDDPNTVLHRLLGLGRDPTTPSQRVPSPVKQRDQPRIQAVSMPNDGRAARGTILAESEYELPTLRYLVQQGGSAPSREVIDAVGEELEASSRLTEADKQRLNSGEIRWRSRAAFQRPRLIQSGDLDPQSPHGIWRITEKGRRRVEDER
jgi:Mrr N-terminal domain